MEPYAVGTVVDYTGSHTHGRYVVTGHCRVSGDLFRASELDQMAANGVNLADAYPDGVAYTIWREGVLQKFANRMYSVSRVRRTSMTPVTSPETAPDV